MNILFCEHKIGNIVSIYAVAVKNDITVTVGGSK